MSSFLNGASPMQQAAETERESDIEAGPTTHRSTDLDDGDLSDPFDIARTKNASIERLRRWRLRCEEGKEGHGVPTIALN